ncbi:MAG: prenyltransferase [Vicinamibacteria bacterium]|nr:prenyltransferase [Vicinamibacteria bacterium]
MPIAIWFAETRPRFLMLSVVLAWLGGAIAATSGEFHWGHTLLAATGLLLLHVSVNTRNDHEDFESGLDLRTTRTPFSGGSGILPQGRMTPRQVRMLALGAFALAVPIGAYLTWIRGIELVPLLLFGALAVLFYTSRIQKIGFGLPELTAGLGLGALPVLGITFVNLGSYDPRAIFASIPSGFLVLNLLLMNEFPDREADASIGRRTLPIQLGWRGAAIVYTTVLSATYLWIGAGVFLGLLSPWTLLALATLPAAALAVSGLFGPRDLPRLNRSMGANVIVVLGTQFLMAAGLVISIWM